MKNVILISTIVLMTVFTLTGCNRQDESKKATGPTIADPQVLNDGTEVKFDSNSPALQQFTIDTVRKASLDVSISVQAHNMISVVKSELGEDKLYLFETQDLTDEYSNYLTAVANVEQASLALKREKDLYAHGIAATSDVENAEQNYATNQSSLADAVSRLHAVGITPKELQATPAGSIWTIAEVPEDQIGFIKIGQEATVEFNSYPDKKFTARVSAIGDVIDPNVRTVKVRLVLPNPGGALHPSMYGTAQFMKSGLNLPTIPTAGVIREGDGTMVAWVTSNGHDFLQKKVELGPQEDDKYAVITGLQSGDRVVSRGGVFLSNMLEAMSNE